MTGWFFTNLGWASLVMLLVLALRRPVAAWFGAGAAYALWLLPALRLVMPPLPSFAPDLPAIAPPETLTIWVAEAAPLADPAAPSPWPILIALWAVGAFALIAWQFFSYRRFLADIDASARELGHHRGISLVQSGAAQGPVALGLFQRRIVVPVDFGTRYSAAEQRLALDHEAIHHHRGDLWWNHLGLLVLAANWFNPIAWLAFRAFRADQELACDAAVAASATPDARLDYARALIKSASRPGLIATCPLNHADQLKRRLKMMKTHKESRLRLLGGAATVAALAGVSLALGTPGFAAQQSTPQAEAPKQSEAAPTRERSEERVIIHRIERDGHSEGTASGAHPEHSDRERRVIIMSHGDGERAEGHAAHGDPHVHSFRLRRGEGGPTVVGAHGEHVAAADCQGGQATEVNEGEAGDRTRVLLCSRGNATPAERAERLQRARDRLAGDSELSAEARARVTAALDREIARLRAQ